MRALLLLLVCLPAFAGTAYLTKQEVRGNVKYCYYNYLGTKHVITVQITSSCPQSINVN